MMPNAAAAKSRAFMEVGTEAFYLKAGGETKLLPEQFQRNLGHSVR